MKRLLITGAAGALGHEMRQRLAHLAEIIRLADIAAITDPGPNEEVVQADLADRDAVFRMVEGCDGIMHFGGIPNEQSFDRILDANIIGLYNLYEAARAHGQPRILFASSNHTIGFYPQDQRLTAESGLRPDSLYGVSKCFGEQIAQLYFEKMGQETALVRIGSCTAEPMNYRALSSWLSFGDLARLAERVFAVPRLGCPVVWGASANAAGWWDNSHLAWLGWYPQDNAENWRAAIEARGVPGKDDPLVVLQGGTFASDAIPQG